MIILATLCIAAAVFVLDLFTPLGVGKWGVYVVPLLIAFRTRQRWYPFAFAALCSALLAVRFFYSPVGFDRRWLGAGRLMGMAVLWIIAGVLVQRKRAEEALRESEEKFRVISEEALLGICVIQDGKFVYLNPKQADIYGYTQAELLTLPSVLELVVEEDRALVAENIRRRLNGEVKEMRYRVHARRKDGTIIAVEAFGIRTKLNGKAAIVGTLQDISEREQDHLALEQTTEQLQTLSHRLLEMQEAERRHLSRELHDEIGQALTALKINLQAVQRSADSSPSLLPRLMDSVSIVDRTLRQVRTLSLDLRPSVLDDLGLFAALRWYADQQAQRAGLRVQLSVKFTETRLDPTLETACFRVAQEALTNVVRHAQAKTVLIELGRENDYLHLMVRDDGEGFDPARVRKRKQGDRTLGLMGMEERASLTGGWIEFKSAAGRGTEVHAWFPLSAALPRVRRNGEMTLK